LYNMKKNKKYIEDKDYLYLNVSNQYRGKRRWINWPRYELIKYIKELKFKRHITMHTFRHSHATHLLDKWADLKSVQLSLWHKFITTTEIYTHLSSKFLENTLCLLWNDS
jgi:site-specific recombinase XerD